MKSILLLVALEAHQVEVEYQCREGYCGSCRCRLVAGRGLADRTAGLYQ